jgi:uncharacterized membrane protein YbhN (UPF0104 family)
VNEATGPEPRLPRLRRVSPSSLLRVVLPALAVYVLLAAVDDVDWGVFLDELGDARWGLVAVGFVGAQVPRLTQAASTMGASPVRLRFRRLYTLQLAVSYVNLAIPSSAARVAVNLRFFQRQGVNPAAALSAGALDGLSGFVVQIGLLAGLLLLTPLTLDIDLDAALSGSTGRLLLVVVALAAVVVGTALGVARWRRRILDWTRDLGGEALKALRGLRSPRRLALLFGGNLATEVLFATALATFAHALGGDVSLGEALLINLSVALLSGLLPVPGGIGVAEGGLAYGLIGAGMTDEAAFAAVLLYRLSTFYLPPLWGYVAYRRLEGAGDL